jgi:hypothetical protein
MMRCKITTSKNATIEYWLLILMTRSCGSLLLPSMAREYCRAYYWLRGKKKNQISKTIFFLQC